MLKKLGVYLQYLLPQHLISVIIGQFANSRNVALKNYLIKSFIKIYNVNMSEALQQDATGYVTFNDFFTRKIRLQDRKMELGENNLTSPADGCIAQFGKLQKNTEIIAKNYSFNLKTLCANDDDLMQLFLGGSFITIYLAPPDYHRVHMPVSGNLVRSIFVPGKLFSVNKLSASIIPNIYSRNERYISVFDTSHGKVAVIMVGAFIVGSINVSWQEGAIRGPKERSEQYSNRHLQQASELGYFSLGSTVIVLTQNDRFSFLPLHVDQRVKFGQLLAHAENLS